MRAVIEEETTGNVAAFIAEPIQGVGGFVEAPPGYFERVKSILDETGVLLISDEVQTAFGRTGSHFWGIEAFDVEPDMIMMAKGLGNGLAIGAVMGRAEVVESVAPNLHLSTFGGNPISTAGALANIDYVLDNDLQTNAHEVGSHLKDRLLKMAEDHPIIGEVRGRGLMLALELIGDGLAPDPAAATRFLEACRERGLLVGKGGLKANADPHLPAARHHPRGGRRGGGHLGRSPRRGRRQGEGGLVQTEGVDARRAVEELKELADLTGGPDGARRVAWTDEWKKAREWFRGKLEEIDGITEIETDEAGNVWATAPGDSEKAVLLGGHIDSVPNGGWLDGALNVIGALEVMRVLAPQRRPVTLRLVDWADEEGARFGRSLFGSGAAAGALKPDDVRNLKDRDGVALPDALQEHGVELDRVNEAGKQLENAVAYLELHIEQGPVLERMDLPLGVVLGTFGVERHAVRFTGQHAHSGSTPMDVRRDAFIAAARSAVAFRDDAAARDDVRATTGFVNVSPAIVTAFNGWCEMSLDQRALDPSVLASMLDAAQEVTARVATEEDVSVEWERLWRIEPIPFDDELIGLAEEAVTEVSGQSHRLPSGPLHDAAEMARLMPTVMLFVKSLRGLSHTKDEDTPEEDLELSVLALHRLAEKTMEWAKG